LSTILDHHEDTHRILRNGFKYTMKLVLLYMSLQRLNNIFYKNLAHMII